MTLQEILADEWAFDAERVALIFALTLSLPAYRPPLTSAIKTQ